MLLQITQILLKRKPHEWIWNASKVWSAKASRSMLVDGSSVFFFSSLDTYSFHLLYIITSATGTSSLGCPAAPLQTHVLFMSSRRKKKIPTLLYIMVANNMQRGSNEKGINFWWLSFRTLLVAHNKNQLHVKGFHNLLSICNVIRTISTLEHKNSVY